jgi:hypothetical protein
MSSCFDNTHAERHGPISEDSPRSTSHARDVTSAQDKRSSWWGLNLFSANNISLVSLIFRWWSLHSDGKCVIKGKEMISIRFFKIYSMFYVEWWVNRNLFCFRDPQFTSSSPRDLTSTNGKHRIPCLPTFPRHIISSSEKRIQQIWQPYIKYVCTCFCSKGPGRVR